MSVSTDSPAKYSAEEVLDIIRIGAEIAIQNRTPLDPKAVLALIDRERAQA
jgi:hypothetical protein